MRFRYRIITYCIISFTLVGFLGIYLNDYAPENKKNEIRKNIIVELIEGPVYIPTKNISEKYNYTPLELYLSRITRENAYYYLSTEMGMYRLTSRGKWMAYSVKLCRDVNASFNFNKKECIKSRR
jgi:hypothetical protein